MQFTKFIHHLFNPHCVECKEEKDEKKYQDDINSRCKSCETLRYVLDREINERKKLLDAFLGPKTELNQQYEVPVPITRTRPWGVIKRELEESDRLAAREKQMNKQQLADEKKSTEQLEKELLEDAN